MKIPEYLKIGDTIGICAPSDGINEQDKIEKLDKAILQLQKMGYKVIETPSVRKSDKGRSAIAKLRAEEFMSLWTNKQVKLIIYAGGGDFLMEMLDELDFDIIKNSTPKWTQGYSDITHLSVLLNTICDIPSIYCDAIKSYAMEPLYRNLTDSLKIVSGNAVEQKSFDKHEDVTIQSEENADYTYNLTQKTEWKNITGQDKIVMQGRSIGGCLDCIDTLIGTKYDKVAEYINKYKNDGILWFLEVYEMNTPQLERVLWKMKNAGYFSHCNGIIFGRPLIMREDYDLSANEAISEVIGKMNIPIIAEADIGHVAPQLAVVQGAVLKVVSQNGKGVIETILK